MLKSLLLNSRLQFVYGATSNSFATSYKLIIRRSVTRSACADAPLTIFRWNAPNGARPKNWRKRDDAVSTVRRRIGAFSKPIGSKPTINKMLFVFREALKAKHNIAVTVRVPAIYCYYPVKGDPFCSALLFVNNGLINCVCCRRNSADCQEGVTSLIRKKEKMINLICFIGERENKYTNKITLLMVKST